MDGPGHVLHRRAVRDIGTIGLFADGYAVTKFKEETCVSTGAPGARPDFRGHRLPMFRRRRCLLMYAEAVLRGGSGDKAAALYVNAVRDRGYKALVA